MSDTKSLPRSDKPQIILVVDDNLDLCRPMVSLLKHMGYDGQYATGGQEALKMISGTLPDLVILDVMMPDMDGMEVLKRLKTDQRTENLPVVMFSALTDPEFRAQAIDRGAIDYWIKAGLEFSELRGRIKKILVPSPLQ